MSSGKYPAGHRWFTLWNTFVWFVLIFVMFLVVIGLVRFLAHHDLFMADVRNFLLFIGTIFGGFWIWLTLQVPPHLVTLTVGVLAFLVGLLGWSQKRKADRKTEWWRRAQYALDLALAEDSKKAKTGFRMLTHVSSATERRFPSFTRQPLADKNDLDLIFSLSETIACDLADTSLKRTFADHQLEPIEKEGDDNG